MVCNRKNVGYRNLGDFVINFLNSQISKTVNSKNAYRLFKEHCIENRLSNEEVLKLLRKTSRYYGAFIGENNYYNESIMNYLKAFYIIKQTTVLPFIFKIFNDYEDKNIDEETLCKVLEYTLTYLIRITTCEINKNLSKFMKAMYSRAINGKYDNYYERIVIFLNDLKANDRMPTDKEFEEALIYKPIYKKSICKFILSTIENSTKENIDISNLTIEHILPQKENVAIWKKEIGENYSRVYEVYLHTLGNLTITGNNSELGTKSFSEKKRIIKENSKANILNKEVLSSNIWNEDSILKRARILSKIVIDKFRYVDIHSEFIEESGVNFGVNSGIDFSNTEPESFYFLGEHTKVSKWNDLLIKFINIAYDLDNETIRHLADKDYSIRNAERIYISNDNRKLRRAKEIDNSGIFFETNLSANNIISFIKDLMLEMNLDLDDFSFSILESFDINNENTWGKGTLPVAKLFYFLIEDLINKSKINSEEINNLKSKEYTNSIFELTNYPAIANNKDDHKGNSSTKRYRVKALKFEGKDIYITTQFFEPDRKAIIEWYKEHLN